MIIMISFKNFLFSISPLFFFLFRWSTFFWNKFASFFIFLCARHSGMPASLGWHVEHERGRIIRNRVLANTSLLVVFLSSSFTSLGSSCCSLSVTTSNSIGADFQRNKLKFRFDSISMEFLYIYIYVGVSQSNIWKIPFLFVLLSTKMRSFFFFFSPLKY